MEKAKIWFPVESNPLNRLPNNVTVDYVLYGKRPGLEKNLGFLE